MVTSEDSIKTVKLLGVDNGVKSDKSTGPLRSFSVSFSPEQTTDRVSHILFSLSKKTLMITLRNPYLQL